MTRYLTAEDLILETRDASDIANATQTYLTTNQYANSDNALAAAKYQQYQSLLNQQNSLSNIAMTTSTFLGGIGSALSGTTTSIFQPTNITTSGAVGIGLGSSIYSGVQQAAVAPSIDDYFFSTVRIIEGPKGGTVFPQVDGTWNVIRKYNNKRPYSPLVHAMLDRRFFDAKKVSLDAFGDLCLCNGHAPKPWVEQLEAFGIVFV